MSGMNFHRIQIFVLTLIVISATIRAEVPGTMNYQGRLTDAEGNPIADMPHNLTFRIYDEANTILWEESHTITTTEGLFTVQLGSNGSPLTADIFGFAEGRLGITVDADPEITPRTKLGTVPYAFRAGSVQADDIVNGPGVAAYSGAFYVYLDDQAITVLGSSTITCPAAGYVLATAHGRIATMPQHTSGVNSYAIVGISDVATALPGNQDLDFQIPPAAPSGLYAFPFGMTSMFTVTAPGTYTYYYLAYEFSGSVSVADMQLNLVYFPTAYGEVDPVPPPVKESEGDLSAGPGEPIPPIGDILQADPAESNIARLERELAAMKTRIEAIQHRLDSCNLD